MSDRAVSCPECGCPISAAPAVAAPQSNPEDIGKLLVLARRAREGADSKNAKRYYDQILDKDPGNWEAIFFSVYYEASACKIRDISSAANSVANCVFSTFSAIADLKDEAQQEAALNTVTTAALAIVELFVASAVSHYNSFSTTNNAFGECSGRVVAAGNIYSEIESGLKKVFPDQKQRLADHQKQYVAFLRDQSRWYNGTFLERNRSRLDSEIGAFYPEHLKKRELEQKIAALNMQIGALVTERKANLGCIGYFFLPVGVIMLVLGLVLMSLNGEIWPILVAIPELVIGGICMRKTPSEEVVEENKKKKQLLTADRDALQKELDQLEA